MNVLYKLFCRAYQAVFRALIPVLPYRQPRRLDRVEQVPEVLKKLSLDRTLLEAFYTRVAGEQERAA